MERIEGHRIITGTVRRHGDDIPGFFGSHVAYHTAFRQSLTHDAIGENIEGQLLLTVKIGGAGNPQVAGANGIDDVF